MSPQLAECIAALPEGHWKPGRSQIDAIRKWGRGQLPARRRKKGCEGDRGDLGVLVEFSGDSPLEGESRANSSLSQNSLLQGKYREFPIFGRKWDQHKVGARRITRKDGLVLIVS